MGKNEKDIMTIPGDNGIWMFELTTGSKYTGMILDRHDNAVEVMAKNDKGQNVAMNILMSQIVACWTVIEDVVQED